MIKDVRNSQRQIDITPLKVFVIKNFPNNSALRTVITSEPDLIDVEDFTSQVRIWLRLLEHEFPSKWEVELNDG